LELLFDSNLAGDFNDNVLSADDYQIGFTPGENKVGGPDAYLWFPKSKAGRPANTPVSGCQDTGNGFFLETAVPWSTFAITPAGGTKFGFVLSVSDNGHEGHNRTAKFDLVGEYPQVDQPNYLGHADIRSVSQYSLK